ncbi:hypothetical protein C4D60_Mb09t08160 [Musa balbisiana]|uniref:Uncharacterized protein n=1 Tax=Musa balbisiana TaxID=52838 RepID=A0A4S8IEU7_MUSBA|nr:hypothetical protein C4D60_Mb09t08160 [Musa balbisiana]
MNKEIGTPSLGSEVSFRWFPSLPSKSPLTKQALKEMFREYGSSKRNTCFISLLFMGFQHCRRSRRITMPTRLEGMRCLSSDPLQKIPFGIYRIANNFSQFRESFINCNGNSTLIMPCWNAWAKLSGKVHSILVILIDD